MKRGTDRSSLRVYLKQETNIKRIDVLKIALVGGFCGAILGVLISLVGLV